MCLKTHDFGNSSTSALDSDVSGDEIECTCISEPENIEELLNLSQEAADTDDEGHDPSFNLDSSLKSDTLQQIETFVKNGWHNFQEMTGTL